MTTSSLKPSRSRHFLIPLINTCLRKLVRHVSTAWVDTKDKDDDNRQSVDKFCSFCGTHGHLKANCDFMAKLIIANASLKTVDAKSKEKLQESYRQEQEKRRNRKIKKRLGTIRKVMDEGGHLSDIEPLLDGLPDLIDHTNSDSDSESSDTETETNPHDNE